MSPPSDRWGYATTPGFEGWEPARIAGSLAALGYRFLEWTPDFCSAGDDAEHNVERLVEATRSAGMAVSQVLAMADYVTGDNAARHTAVELTCRIIDAAAANGVQTVGVYAGPDSWDPKAPRLHDDIGAGEAWRFVFSALDVVLAHAESRHVVLTFKPCVGTLAKDYFSSLPVIERYSASDAFAVNFDPSHFALEANDVAWTIAQFGSLIRHVELKDVFGIPGLEGRHFNFPLIGDGLVDWRQFLGALSSVGYDGPLVALFETYRLQEQFLDGDPIAAAKMTMDRLRLLEAAVSNTDEAAA